MSGPEKLNSITHLTGTIATLIGIPILIVLASRQGDPWKIVSFSIYGTSLIFLYLSSSLYHLFDGRSKRIFRRMDHIGIYLLIAGTYTPLTLITLRGTWGWSLFGTIWGLAIAGIVIDSLPHRGSHRVLPVVIYLLMGWLCVVAIRPLLLALSPEAFGWLLAGGIFYTAGVPFYALDSRIPYFHPVWHMFVIAGSVCHYVTIFRFLL